MSTSWHDFLYASMDKAGLMTVDKPPLSLWVQALSVRLFGFHPLSILIPQALMGVAATALIYDLTRRRFGRPAGFVAGIVLATTPIVVAVSRHNNPDELLVLCCVAALWFAMRALETGRTRWLVLSGICVGLGFEAKMGVALMIVPGIAAAYLYVAPRGRVRAIGQLLAGGAALAVVGLAWPVFVTLTPAADRPWISGTADNSIWSLIFSYNGVGRIAGQSGGPATFDGGGGGVFGGGTGVLRLLQSSLGDQAGWLLGFALVAGAGVLVASRLRRSDPRTGWLIAVGGAFLTTAIVFSLADGIFHPYYVSFLAPFTAALIGAGVGLALADGRRARILAPLALAAGAVTELAVLGTLDGALSWARPLVIGATLVCAIVLALKLSIRARAAVLAVALAALLAAPATWAAQTLGHATSGTFPAGGPASAGSLGGFGGPGGPSGFGRHGRLPRRLPGAGRRVSRRRRLPGRRCLPAGLAAGAAGRACRREPVWASHRPGLARARRLRSPAVRSAPAGAFGGGLGAGVFGGDSATLNAALAYAKAHGGGTIGVSSQSTAAAVIVSADANVAGFGGFSGRESSVTAAWIAIEVRDGRLRWVINDGAQDFHARGDTRTGSAKAFSIVAKTCRPVTVRPSKGSSFTMYDCKGRAAAINAAQQAMSVSKIKLAVVLTAAGALALCAAPAALANTTKSSNWAGYAVHRSGVKFKKVSGRWKVPAASCAAGSRGFSSDLGRAWRIQR